MTTTYSVAIVGATGLVGSMMLSLLEERHFPTNNLYLLASQQSIGKEYYFHGKKLTVTELTTFDFRRTNIAFFCVNNQLAAEYAPQAAACGNIVIDKSSFFRCKNNVPLIIPEVNMKALAHYRQKS